MVDAVSSGSTSGAPAVVKVTDTDGNKANALAVVVVGTDGVAASSGSGGTQYTEDVAAAADPVGTIVMGVRRDTLSASEVSANGDNVALKMTSKGEAYVHDTDVLAQLVTLAGHLDGLEGFSDGIESLISSTNTLLTTQASYVDGLETLLTTQSGYLDGVETLLGTTNTKLNGGLPAALGAGGGLKVDGSGTALPVSGPQTNAEFIAALKSTATHSSVNSGTSSVTILASNANRKGARIFNTDANALYLDLSGGTAAAATRAQVKLATETGYDVPFGCTGTITGIWAADGSGVASVVEFA